MQITTNISYLPWKDIVTLGAAVLGAALGVMNTWNAINQRRVKLRIRPAYAFRTDRKERMFSIETINLSGFPVTIIEVGFTLNARKLGKGERAAVVMPVLADGGSWPRRLELREAVSAYFDPEQVRTGETIGRAYARTACGETAYGSSPALRHLRQERAKSSS